MENDKRKQRATVLPPILGDDGKLLKLKLRDFPATRDGMLLYCDYNIASWQERRRRAETASNPTTRKEAKLEKMRIRLTQLELEIMKEKGDDSV